MASSGAAGDAWMVVDFFSLSLITIGAFGVNGIVGVLGFSVAQIPQTTLVFWYHWYL